MNFVTPLNTEICSECGHESPIEHMSVIFPGLDVWCARKRNLAEIAAQDEQRARDFRALSHEALAPLLIKAAENARALRSPGPQ